LAAHGLGWHGLLGGGTAQTNYNVNTNSNKKRLRKNNRMDKIS